MRRFGYVLLWFVLAAFIFGLTSVNLRLFHRLETRGVKLQATVVKLTPEIHRTLQYRYQVDGEIYENQWAPSPPNPPLDQIIPGQTLEIYYDREYPSVSVPGDPKSEMGNEIIACGLATLLGPTFILFVLAFRKSNLGNR